MTGTHHEAWTRCPAQPTHDCGESSWHPHLTGTMVISVTTRVLWIWLDRLLEAEQWLLAWTMEPRAWSSPSFTTC